MDRLETMTAFVTVAELRGFAPAARRLGVSPSTVTRLVAALEERLATRLLQRTTRSVKLTDLGARYLERARRILAEVEEAEGATRAERAQPTGRLVVAAPGVFGRMEVAPLMCAFLERFPEVRGELVLADRVSHLVDEGVDVAVRIGVLKDSSLHVRKVGETRRVLVGAPKYFARCPRPRKPGDLAKHTLIHFTPLTPTTELTFFRKSVKRRITFSPSFVTNSADAAIGHAERGGGLALVLAYQVAEAVKAGRLRVVLAAYEPPALPIQLVYPSQRLLSVNVRAFMDMAVAARRWSFAL